MQLHEAVTILKQIRKQLREVTSNLNDSITLIESESLGKIKSDVELKAEELEVEVMGLREELRDIKEILGMDLEKKNPDKKYV